MARRVWWGRIGVGFSGGDGEEDVVEENRSGV